MHHRKKTTFAFGLSLSPHKGKQTQTRQHVDEHEGRYIWEGKGGGGGGGLTFPDSLTAGRGEAMPWEKAEAAEKGSGAFSLSPKGSGRSRVE